MNLLYDHQIFDFQRYGGISRYFHELMRVYAATGEPRFHLACPYTTNAYLWEAPFLRLNTPFTRHRFPGSGVVNNILGRRCNRPASVAALRSRDYDLFHPTYYDPYFLDHLGDKPFVLTVHDMTHERYPDCYPAGDPTSNRKRLLVERASCIIADSGSTRRDLLEFYDVPAEKVAVVHLGCSLPNPGADAILPSLPGQYLLYVGERSRYKNFAFAVRDLAPLFREQPELRLVCVGGGPLRGEETLLLETLGVRGRCLQLNLSDRELALAYSRAVALLFPSLCEGFGIPLLEAFTCGCPVLSSNRTSLPEVGGDAALYFDPESPGELLHQAGRIMVDAELRAELANRGLMRAREFTWERTARATLAVYATVLRGGGS